MRWLLIFLFACAQDVHATFPGMKQAEPSGTLVILFGNAATDVAVSVDGWLVFDDAHTSKIVIDGIPAGTREVALAANGADKQFRVWISPDHPTTVPIGMPDGSYGFLKTLAGSLITIIVYSLLHG